MQKKRNVILAVLSILFMGLVGSYELVNNVLVGESKTCTVDGAQNIQDYNGGAPTSTVEVQTTDCGEIIITRMKHPEGVNMAKLAQVLEDHRGEKFEFVGTYLQLQKNVFASTGVNSLDPIH